MAEKKKVEREFVEASTGKTGKRPAVVTAANKKSATGKRIAAVILWVLALAAEVGAILMLNGTWYIPEEQKMYWLIGALVIDLILVIIGSPAVEKGQPAGPRQQAEQREVLPVEQYGADRLRYLFLAHCHPAAGQ